jgi:TetR/AcrR family transcriptional repressor of nem operon
MIQFVTEFLPDESPQQAREIATGVIATMVGSVLLSRAVQNTAVSNNILDAGRKTAGAMRGRNARRAANDAAGNDVHDGASAS